MFPESYRKAVAFIVISVVLGLGVMTLIMPGLEPTSAMAVLEPSPSISWPIFFFGLAVGAIILGATVYLAHYERQR